MQLAAMPPADPAPLISAPVIPVLTIERLADAVPLARALVAGGLPVIEVTLRTQVALDAVRAIVEQVPDAVVGVGTLTRQDEIMWAFDAGAAFLVTPGTSAALADALMNAPIPVLPGCSTVSEAMALAERGFPVLKFFPAETAGGVRWLKSIASPLPGLRFCPTGGIDSYKAPAYLALSNVIAVGGSWVAPDDAVASGDFARVTALAQAAVRLRDPA